MALLNFCVGVEYKVFPCFSDDTRVIEVRGVVDEKAQVVVTGLVRVVVEELL